MIAQSSSYVSKDIILKNLYDLGLTQTQAKLYSLLLTEDCCTFGHLSKISNIARPEVYREVKHLGKYGLVEELVGRPKKIRACDIRFALKQYVHEKKENLNKEILNLDNILTNILNNPFLKKKNNIEENLKDIQFVVMSPKSLIFSKILSMFDTAEKEIILVCSSKIVYKFFNDFYSQIDVALKSVDSMRVLTTNDFSLDVLNSMHPESKLNFKKIIFRKFLPDSICSFCVDRKQIIFDTGFAMNYPTDTPKLWTNCPIVLSTMNMYFDERWLQAKAIERIVNII